MKQVFSQPKWQKTSNRIVEKDKFLVSEKSSRKSLVKGNKYPKDTTTPDRDAQFVKGKLDCETSNHVLKSFADLYPI